MTIKALITSSRPTNRELGDGVNAAHECIHAVGEKVDDLAEAFGHKVDELAATVRENRHQATNRDQLMDVRIARIEGALGVGVTPKELASGARRRRVGRRFGGLPTWQAILSMLGALTGALGIYRYLFPALEAGAPAVLTGLRAGLVALHHALMTAPT